MYSISFYTYEQHTLKWPHLKIDLKLKLDLLWTSYFFIPARLTNGNRVGGPGLSKVIFNLKDFRQVYPRLSTSSSEQ
ncbi:unnamed protein product [Ilex paraguariensis]|uniref:Uncharacterized protein n=1 Tax=Ilex paraguariensis TaxID=185542 RepID=A0ABC8U1I0_9AQUA